MPSHIRRLPGYNLLDCSGYMTGESVEAGKQGLKALLDEPNPQESETAYLSVIEFASEARRTVPLTELVRFQVPVVSPAGTTSADVALELLPERSGEEAQTHRLSVPPRAPCRQIRGGAWMRSRDLNMFDGPRLIPWHVRSSTFPDERSNRELMAYVRKLQGG